MSESIKAYGRELDPEALYRVTVSRTTPHPASAVPRYLRPSGDNLLKGKIVLELPPAVIVKVEPAELV